MKIMRGFFFLVAISVVSAKDVKVLEMRDFRYKDFTEQGFTLNQDVRVKIEAWGASDRREDEMLAYGWILESETRRVVWEMTVDNSSAERREYNRRSEEMIRLSSGSYELYYAVSPRGAWSGDYRDFGDFLDDLFGGFRKGRWRREARSWGVTLWVEEADQGAVELTDISEDTGAIVQLVPLGDDEFESQGFSLSRDTKLRVYAIGEGDDDEMYDYGWIVDGSTRETVWEMDYRGSRWAGGADKNRMLDEEITLPEGDYLIYFVTDGSHSYDEWNRLPPVDPRHWGITLWGVERGFRKDLVVKPYEPKEELSVIVDITRVGNGRFEEESFTLEKPVKVRVRCLGEYSYSDHFVDYGWILDAKTRETVWKMTRRSTREAGGAKKNRLFDGIISLEPGSYEVYYITDDSHAYRRWNAGPPYNPEAWGITLWGSGEDFDPQSVLPYREEDDADLLVKIVRVGDHERARQRFRLEEPTDVRIYAIGEGDDDEMYDYGWIEDERGRDVWEMEYWETEHAGGARKNRMVNRVIHLKAGEYTVRYRSDGSHSFDDWNDDPPRDSIHWGITVRKER